MYYALYCDISSNDREMKIPNYIINLYFNLIPFDSVTFDLVDTVLSLIFH